MEQDWEKRLVELEIRCALQEELLSSLDATVAKMHETLDLQQQQLRLLYKRLQHQAAAETEKPYSLFEEIPPHY